MLLLLMLLVMVALLATVPAVDGGANEIVKGLLAAYEQKTNEQEALLRKAKDGQASDEEWARIDALNAELDALELQVKRAKGVAAAEEKAGARQAFLQSHPANTLPEPDVSKADDGAAVETKLVPWRFTGTADHFTGTLEERRLKAYQLGRWFLATMCKHAPSMEYCQKAGIEIKTQTEGVNTAGGSLVPVQLSPDIINLQKEYGVARRCCRIRRMGSDEINVPRRTSGLTYYWGAEGAAMTASTKGWDHVTLHAKKLYCLVQFSTELSEDAVIDVGNDLVDEIALAFSKAEDDACFLGDGSSSYGGVLGCIEAMKKTVTDAGGTWTTDAHKTYNPSVVLAAGNAFSEVTLANLHSMKGAVQRYRRQNSQDRWHCNSALYYSVMERLCSAAGGVTAEEVARAQRSFSEAADGTPIMLGRPVMFTEVMIEAEANSGVPLIYGDLGLACTLGDRREITLATSAEYAFNQDLMTMRGTARLDIQCHEVGAAHASVAASRARAPYSILALANA